MAVIKLYGFFMPLISFLAGFTSLIVLLAGGRRVVLGLMTPGDLVALFSYMNMLIWPMFGAGFTVNIVQRGAVSLRRINEILDTEPSIKNTRIEFGGNAEVSSGSGYGDGIIEIKNLSFAYGEGKNVLRGISLTVKEGAALGLLGRTGAGKSTLVKLLPRMLDPPPGTVFIKGRDVRNWDLGALRSLFGVSPQDSFMFSDSIKNNLAYGHDGADNSLVKTMCGISALDRDIETFSDGVETLIGERGLTLSGGQKQRLSIARAIIVQPEILILDDSLSAVDAETEKQIVKNIYSARKNKTTIIISHRVSAFSGADFAAVLEGGSLAEYGAPAVLMESGGYFSRTAALQQLYG